jgi:hypothetical protein
MRKISGSQPLPRPSAVVEEKNYAPVVSTPPHLPPLSEAPKSTALTLPQPIRQSPHAKLTTFLRNFIFLKDDKIANVQARQAMGVLVDKLAARGADDVLKNLYRSFLKDTHRSGLENEILKAAAEGDADFIEAVQVAESYLRYADKVMVSRIWGRVFEVALQKQHIKILASPLFLDERVNDKRALELEIAITKHDFETVALQNYYQALKLAAKNGWVEKFKWLVQQDVPSRDKMLKDFCADEAIGLKNFAPAIYRSLVFDSGLHLRHTIMKFIDHLISSNHIAAICHLLEQNKIVHIRAVVLSSIFKYDSVPLYLAISNLRHFDFEHRLLGHDSKPVCLMYLAGKISRQHSHVVFKEAIRMGKIANAQVLLEEGFSPDPSDWLEALKNAPDLATLRFVESRGSVLPSERQRAKMAIASENWEELRVILQTAKEPLKDLFLIDTGVQPDLLLALAHLNSGRTFSDEQLFAFCKRYESPKMAFRIFRSSAVPQISQPGPEYRKFWSNLMLEHGEIGVKIAEQLAGEVIADDKVELRLSDFKTPYKTLLTSLAPALAYGCRANGAGCDTHLVSPEAMPTHKQHMALCFRAMVDPKIFMTCIELLHERTFMLAIRPCVLPKGPFVLQEAQDAKETFYLMQLAPGDYRQTQFSEFTSCCLGIGPDHPCHRELISTLKSRYSCLYGVFVSKNGGVEPETDELIGGSRAYVNDNNLVHQSIEIRLEYRAKAQQSIGSLFVQAAKTMVAENGYDYVTVGCGTYTQTPTRYLEKLGALRIRPIKAPPDILEYSVDTDMQLCLAAKHPLDE